MADHIVNEGADEAEPVPVPELEADGPSAEAGPEPDAEPAEPEPDSESDPADSDPAASESDPESVEPAEPVEPEPESLRSLQRARRSKRRRRFKIALLAITATTAVGAATVFGLAAWDIQHLTKNLKHTALLPAGFTEPAESVDAYGRSPINILLIGSDTRSTGADCSLGGDCGTGANADSEMIVHLSADRSNATVLSIPRDTETDLPDCAGGGRGMVNSALQYGASCQVATDVKLTGITIDHYMMFDFSGVVDLSSELGGVPVCVSASVHDPNSGLTISGGTTNVEGKQALQFLRTRDAFYDGSDLGREQASHIFLSSLLRKVKASATLTNLGELQSIAETVTRYTTVDNGLDSATALLSLANDFGEVDADRTTFLTMPWQQDTDTGDPSYQDRVEASSDAQGVFQAIQQDKSFTTSGGSSSSSSASASASESASATASASASGSAGASATASASASKSSSPNASEEAAARAHPMHVNVVNASGTTNRHQTVVQQVFQDGFVYSSGSDATATQASTTLVYSAKEVAAANELATDLHLPSSALKETGTGTTLVLTIGTDWTTGATYSTAGSSYSASAAISVPSDSYEENGANSAACVTANPQYETGSGTSSASQ
ncbi:LCP family protein [Actinospica sp.]|uniref:LCP family glycopolymer transferase n=1 Tax=Actinospica sp. TaxID=1872142 RepID=UPI002BB62EBB|nr:LCP family protein [Actinospica sp.]HWG27396.1 LCP family protein [Actinospica sp.]